MTNYVLGFAFGHTKETVVLVRKNRPDWQLGKLNGIGGHVEPTDSTMLDAVQREFEEETGLLVDSWAHYITMRNKAWRVFVFRAYNVEVSNVRTLTDERVEVHPVLRLPTNVLSNLRWLIPLALDPDKPTLVEVTYQ